MTGPKSSGDRPLPKATVTRRRWFPIVWLFPLMAVIVSGFLAYDYVRRKGPTIEIAFTDAAGVVPGQTVVRYRGVVVGRVQEVDVSDDLQNIRVTARLSKGAAALAREGSRFWIVRPQLRVGSISGLDTLLGGPYIQAMAGDGPEATKFGGLTHPPVVRSEEGVTVLLLSPYLGSLKEGSPVYFRGLQVGVIEKVELARNSNAVNIYAHIEQEYSSLVRAGSKFWNVGGFNLDFGLFRGAEIRLESLAALLTGGVAFATPPSTRTGEANSDQLVFELHEKPEDEWLTWTPTILLPIKSDDTGTESLTIGTGK